MIILGRAHGKALLEGKVFFPCRCVVFILPPSPIRKKRKISIKNHYIFSWPDQGRIEKRSSPDHPPKLLSICIYGKKPVLIIPRKMDDGCNK